MTLRRHPRSKPCLRQRRLTLEALEPRQVLAANVLITEFVASNGASLLDGDGKDSDWIELYNPTSAAVSLAGWHLTDEATNLDKWTFPEIPQSVLDPGEFLIVFASGQLVETYVDPAGYMHTDFALSSDGEYLALTDPTDTIVHEYTPQFPAQRRDVSYGVLENIATLELVGPTTGTRAFVPTTGALDAPSADAPPAWTLPGFNDAGWQSTTAGPGVGYDSGDEPVPNIPNGVLLPEGLVGSDFTDPDENGVPNGTIFAGGFPGSPAGEEPDKGLDNTTSSKWLAFEPTGTYYGFRFAGGVKQIVSAYTLTSANDAADRDPYSWTLSGSNDGVNYTVIDTRNAQTFASRFETRLYQFNNSTAYEYYKFDIKTRYGVTGTNQPVAVQVAEFELLSNGQVDYTPHIDLSVAAAWNAARTSVYQRVAFNVTDPAALATLRLDLQYDDGFVAYLNGKRVAAAAAPVLPNYQSNASSQRTDAESLVPVSFNLTPYLGDLVAGENVLAIHVLNHTDDSPDLLSTPRLVATELLDATLSKVFMTQPTPGTPNVAGFAGMVSDPVFSVERGFYNAPFSVTITSATPGAAVYYTTNGSDPAPGSGTLYTGPINVSATSTIRAQAYYAGYIASLPTTNTYLFVNDIVRQNAAATLAKGFPASWGSVAPDYGMDPDVIGNFNASGAPTGGDRFGGVYAATIKNDLQAIPTMSIVMDINDLFGPNGIYTNSLASGEAWERATSVELINPDGTPGFQIEAGIRMHGGAFRNHSLSKKHSMRLVFKGIYDGNTKLDYPLFGDDAATSFDTLVLRMDSNDGYAWDAAGNRAQYARDEFGRRTQEDLGQVSSHGTRVHLYINGVYWGIYNPVERPDDSFSATYYGGDKDDWDALNTGTVNSGSIDAWNTLVSLSQAVSTAANEAARTAAYMRVLGLNSNGTDNPTFDAYLDAANYVDYLMVNFFTGNNDWPQRNWWASRQRGPESTGFKFHMWDAEWTLDLNADVNINRLGVSTLVAQPYANLKNSLEFRTLFSDRVHRAFFNNGPMSLASNAARYQEITSEIAQAIVAESARWGDMHSPTPYVKSQWQSEITDVLNWLNARNGVFLTQLRAAGLYSSVIAPTFSQHGGEVPPGYFLAVTAPAGTIWYTLDGSDPRMIGGAVQPGAIQYTGPIQIPAGLTLKARVLSGGVWSALNEAVFTTASAPNASNLRISEIHYNPAAQGALADEQDLEFIELFNPSGQPVSLAGVEIRHFISDPYEFAGDQTLGAGQRLIVARNPAVFQSVYGSGVNIAPTGYGDGNLGNSGERIALVAPGELVIQDFNFDDGGGWPAAADGQGQSLELINPLADPTSPADWRASFYRGGSPGTEGSPPAVAGDFDGDGDADGNDFLRWQRGLGTPQLHASAAQGDADGDRDVDAADLALWRGNFGAAEAVRLSDEDAGIDAVALAHALERPAASQRASRPGRRPAFTPAPAAAPGPITDRFVLQRRLDVTNEPANYDDAATEAVDQAFEQLASFALGS
jgi:hypothetical protein